MGVWSTFSSLVPTTLSTPGRVPGTSAENQRGASHCRADRGAPRRRTRGRNACMSRLRSDARQRHPGAPNSLDRARSDTEEHVKPGKFNSKGKPAHQCRPNRREGRKSQNSSTARTLARSRGLKNCGRRIPSRPEQGQSAHACFLRHELNAGALRRPSGAADAGTTPSKEGEVGSISSDIPLSRRSQRPGRFVVKDTISAIPGSINSRLSGTFSNRCMTVC